MKRIKMVLILFILLIPVLAKASTFSAEKTNVNNYMTRSNYKNTYRRYIINKYDENGKYKDRLKFYMDDNGILSDKANNKDINAGFTDGGFISKREYLLTVPEKGTSYLYDGSTYWTLTCNNESKKCFVIEYTGALDQSGISEYLNYTTSPNIRSKATEFVKKDTKVTGTGKKSDPWIFVPKYKVTIKVSDANKANIKYNGDLTPEIDNIYLSGRCTGEGCSEAVELVLNEGYNYLSNDCDGSYNETTKKFTVSNISKDIVCTINVGIGKFKVTLGKKSYDLRKNIYLRHKENFYSDSGYTNILYDIKSLNNGNLPKRDGYKFLGYNLEGTQIQIINKDGEIKDKTSITKDEVLESKWQVLKYNITFDPNGGKMNESEKTREVTYDEPYGGKNNNMPIATRIGHSFEGWYTALTGGIKITSETKVTTDTIPNNRVLYAHWTKCRAGSYNIGNNTTCTSCPVGTYQDKEGQSSCITCVTGSTSSESATKCIPCDSGKTTASNSLSCIDCENRQDVYSWKKTNWNLDNTMTNLCTIESCNEGYKVKNNLCVSICSDGYIYIDGECKPRKTEWTVAGDYEYVPFKTGKYSLEVWGGQGGMVDYYNQGYGGYSYGEIELQKNSLLYVYVGGKGQSWPLYNGGTGGFNGGGTGGKSVARNVYGGAGGGGASHIATRPGLLSELKDYNSDILIVAGGGGGNGLIGSPERDCYNAKAGGSGGGYKGNNGSTDNIGGTQNSGHLFGIGATGRNASYANSAWWCGLEGGAGSGGGYYGGTTSTKIGGNSDSGGAGGSGYIGNTLLNNKYMYCYKCSQSNEVSIRTYSTNSFNEKPVSKSAKSGSGAARITYIGN